jgi:hypothetical protein
VLGGAEAEAVNVLPTSAIDAQKFDMASV